MTQFDTEQTALYLKRSRQYRRIDVAYFVAIVITGLICAALFASDNELEMAHKTAYIVLLIVDIVAIALYIAFNVAFVFKNSARLRREVKRIMYADLDAHAEMFEGDDVTIRVDFHGDVLSVARDGEVLEYDVAALKVAPDAYSSCGTMLYDYLTASWQLRCEEGFKGNVKFIDCTAKKDEVAVIVQGGVPTKKFKDPLKVLGREDR